jgi:hypothetical protein
MTGANGGVGSIAVAILANLGHHLIAATGRLQHADRPRDLGAAEVIDRAELTEPGKPLGKQRQAGRDRHGRRPSPRQRMRIDALRRHRRRLRQCRRNEPSWIGGALHPARVTLVGVESAQTPCLGVRGVAPARQRPRPGLARLAHQRGRAHLGSYDRTRPTRWTCARPGRGRHQPLGPAAPRCGKQAAAPFHATRHSPQPRAALSLSPATSSTAFAGTTATFHALGH